MAKQQPSADKVPKIIWPDHGRVSHYETRKGALFAVEGLRARGYEVTEDRDGDFVVYEPLSE